MKSSLIFKWHIQTKSNKEWLSSSWAFEDLSKSSKGPSPPLPSPQTSEVKFKFNSAHERNPSFHQTLWKYKEKSGSILFLLEQRIIKSNTKRDLSNQLSSLFPFLFFFKKGSWGLKMANSHISLPLKAGKFLPHAPPQPSSTNEDAVSTDDIICFHVESLPSQGSGGVLWGPSQSWPSPPPSAGAPIWTTDQLTLAPYFAQSMASLNGLYSSIDVSVTKISTLNDP